MIGSRFVLSLLLAGLMTSPVAFATTAAPVALQTEQVNKYLLDAARAGDASLVSDLVKAGVDIETRSAKGHTALTLAAYNAKLDVMNVLIVAGADINSGDERGNTPLMGAIFKGDDAVFKRLLAAPNIAVNQRNSAGQTAVMYAALFGRETMIDALLENGADISAVDASGKRASILARMQGNEALAQRLDTLEAKAP